MPIRSETWPTVIVLPALAVLAGLGIWQVDLSLEKTALIEEIATRGAAPAIALSTDSRIPLEDFLYRPIFVTGKFDHGAEFLLAGGRDGGPPGFQIVTPLRRSDGQGVLLVDRGWIPADRRDPERRPGSRPGAEVTVTGIIRPPEPPGWRTPANDPENHQWHFIDLEEMARVARIWPPPDFYLKATSGWGADWPRPNDRRFVPVNNHLPYAIAAFALAGALLAALVVYRRYRARRDEA